MLKYTSKYRESVMIREIIRPQYTNLTINIPTDYIDRDVELLIFPISKKDINQDAKKEKIKKSLKGVFNQYADKSKISLEDSAWQNYVVEKFKQND